MNDIEVYDRGNGVLECLREPDWVISDTHFAHANIIRHCAWRSTWATSIDDHDHQIIAEWNRTVKASDLVLHLGDFALCQEARIAAIRLSLPGRIMLVRGNHDRSATAMRRCYFDWVCSQVVIRSRSHAWLCRHDPSGYTPLQARDHRRLLHGHSHGNGYRHDIPAAVVAQAKDCSLDALKSRAPVAWSLVAHPPQSTE